MRKFILGAGLTATAAFAQQVRIERDVVINHGAHASAEPMRVALPPSAAGFVSAEFVFDEKLTKGAPYSADAVTETTQTFADGNRIHRKSSMQVWRDSEGRTRREHTLAPIPGVPSMPQRKIVMISDPVAGVHYELDPEAKTARKISLPKNASTGTGGKQIYMFSHSGGPGAVSGAMATGSTPHRVERVERVEIRGVEGHSSATAVAAKEESIGTRTIEGLVCDGTRTASTIPAGQIGNDKPIEMVSERWFSKDLNTTMMTKRNDPRSGENTFGLTNIRRSEPVKSLFEVPADYKIEDVKMNYSFSHSESSSSTKH